MKKCIVSFANSRGAYIERLARLGDSLRGNFDGDFLGFIGEASIGAPLHLENPYSFKIYAIDRAIEQGYTQILWLDSSCFAIKNVQPTFEYIEKNGMIFQEAGHFLGIWSSDKQLKYFGLSRDEAMNVKMIGNAGFLGFNFNNQIAIDFFKEWKQAMLDGMFLGEWNNNFKTESEDERCKGSRHDMSCSSALVYKMGLTHIMKSGNEELQYAGIFDETLNNTIIWKAQG